MNIDNVLKSHGIMNNKKNIKFDNYSIEESDLEYVSHELQDTSSDLENIMPFDNGIFFTQNRLYGHIYRIENKEIIHREIKFDSYLSNEKICIANNNIYILSYCGGYFLKKLDKDLKLTSEIKLDTSCNRISQMIIINDNIFIRYVDNDNRTYKLIKCDMELNTIISTTITDKKMIKYTNNQLLIGNEVYNTNLELIKKIDIPQNYYSILIKNNKIVMYINNDPYRLEQYNIEGGLVKTKEMLPNNSWHIGFDEDYIYASYGNDYNSIIKENLTTKITYPLSYINLIDSSIEKVRILCSTKNNIILIATYQNRDKKILFMTKPSIHLN